MATRPTGAATNRRVSGREWPGWYAEAVATNQTVIDLNEHAAFMARLQVEVETQRRMGDMLIEHIRTSYRPFWRAD